MTRREGELVRRHNWAKSDLSKTNLSLNDEKCRYSTEYDIEYNEYENKKRPVLGTREFNIRQDAWLPEKIKLPLPS